MPAKRLGRQIQSIAIAAVALVVAGAGWAAWTRRPTGSASDDRGVTRVRITMQYGLSYLPLNVMQSNHLIEKQAKAAGLGDVQVEWTTLSNGSAASDAILSGSADVVALGVAPLITLWDKSGGEVRALAAVSTSPMYLNTIKPGVRTIADFGRLDKLCVSMKHPDGAAALLGGHSEIVAHMTNAPFQDQELRDPRVHRVLSSYDVLCGPHTHAVLATTQTFRARSPGLCAAIYHALEEADAQINADRASAAQVYREATRTNETITDLAEQVQQPGLDFTPAPARVGTFASFMRQVGTIRSEPASWKDLFFPEVHSLRGS